MTQQWIPSDRMGERRRLDLQEHETSTYLVCVIRLGSSAHSCDLSRGAMLGRSITTVDLGFLFLSKLCLLMKRSVHDSEPKA